MLLTVIKVKTHHFNMILVRDNFLEENIFNSLHNYIMNREFEVIQAGDKGFLTIPTPEEINTATAMLINPTNP